MLSQVEPKGYPSGSVDSPPPPGTFVVMQCARCGFCDSTDSLYQEWKEALVRRGWHGELWYKPEHRAWQLLACSPDRYTSVLITNEALAQAISAAKVFDLAGSALLARIDAGETRPLVQGCAIEYDPVTFSRENTIP